jgi:PTH2 family peptidyl-tRNA hydrolase
MPIPNSRKKNTGAKMMLLVNMSLKMDKGKIGAQCGHATIGLYKQVMGKKKYEKMLEAWENNGQKKICAKLKDDGEMNLIISKLTDANIAHYTVIDAGRTQVKAGSRTILAIIDYENKLNQITGNLKLL